MLTLSAFGVVRWAWVCGGQGQNAIAWIWTVSPGAHVLQGYPPPWCYWEVVGRSRGGASGRSLKAGVLNGSVGLQLRFSLSLSSPDHEVGAFAPLQVYAMMCCCPITCPKVPEPPSHGLKVPELSDQINLSCLQVDCFRCCDVVMER